MSFFAPARVLLLWLAVLTAGCGNDPNPQPLRETRADGKPWKVLYGGLPDEVRSLDPQVSYDAVSRRVTEPVYDTLLAYQVMEIEPYAVGPDLLEAVPQHTQNPDGTVTYMCRLKPGNFFHDDPCFPGGKGREIVAGDVQYAFQRLSDPALDSPFFSNFTEYVAGMADVNALAKKAGEALNYDTMKVRGIEVLDAHTFQIHLLKPYPQIIYWLALHCTAPVAREAVEYYDGRQHPDGEGGKMVTRPLFKFHPVGTGAFRIADWVRNQRFRLVRNENYHAMVFPSGGWPPEREAINRPLAGQSLPLVDEVQLTVFREILPQWLLTRQGYIDRFGAQKDAINSLVSATKELTPQYAARGMKLGKAMEVSTFYMSVNMQDPIIGTNRKLRQALSCAYDPKGFSELLYGGVAPTATQILSPGVIGFDKDFQNPYGPNVEKSRRLIAEAGYPGGRDPKTGQPLEITLDCVATGSEERQLAEYIQRQLEQCGVRIKVVENTFARMLEKEDQGNYQLCTGTGWGADYPDPENYFFLFASKNFPPEGKNISRYKNPEFDRLFEQMATMDNSPERLQIVRQMNVMLTEDVPIILDFNKAYYVVEMPWSRRTHQNMLLEGGLKYLYIDPVLRAQKRREWNPVPLWPLAVLAGVVLAGLGYGLLLNRRRNV